MSTENRVVPSDQVRALAAALPGMSREMRRLNQLIVTGHRPEAIERFHGLVAMAIRTHRDDLSCKGYVIPGRKTEISVCRIPAEPRPDKPIALFLSGLLNFMPLTAVRALAFADLFDIVLCELPGHGVSGMIDEVSIAAFAAEYAALIDTALKRAATLSIIGESLGGLVAVALGHLRPGQIRNVILIDTPFHLTRPDLAAWISEAWRDAGSLPYVRRICIEIMGFDPIDAKVRRTVSLHDMVRHAPFTCVHITGGDQQSSGIPSVVHEIDIAALHAANPAILVTPRVHGTGHAVLLDNPDGARAALEAFIVPHQPAH